MRASATSRVGLRGVAGAACLFALAMAAARCSGTTGREGLTVSETDGGVDATIADDLDAGTFDVVIAYADRVLPDVVAPVDAGPGSGPKWPSCPPFVPVDQNGNPVPLGQELDQVPAAYDDAGKIVLAPDGSACATYGWLGSTAADDCVTSQTAGGQDDFVELPPCNWAGDAGVAAQGSGAGRPRVDLCLELYACVTSTGCGARDVTTCLCGPDTNGADCVKNATGPCMKEEMAALELPAGSIQQALQNYVNESPSFLGYGGSLLNWLFSNGKTYDCFAVDAGED
jgi:hypothetical protein